MCACPWPCADIGDLVPGAAGEEVIDKLGRRLRDEGMLFRFHAVTARESPRLLEMVDTRVRPP